MEIITTPWKDRFLELIANSKRTIKITSPFVKKNICDEILDAKQNNSSFELITSFKLMYLYSGSVDIDGIEKILRNKGIVKNFSQLHAKVYLFDDKEVIITSSNLTNGGLLHNFEYGIYSNDKHIVTKVVSDFDLLSKNEDIGSIKLQDIDAVKVVLSKLPKYKKITIPEYKIETPENQLDIIEIDNSIITSSLSGWKLEVFKCIQQIQSQIFTSDDINRFENHLKSIYPTNKNILAKIRQQLQILRDMGLIEFLGKGKYKKLWK